MLNKLLNYRTCYIQTITILEDWEKTCDLMLTVGVQGKTKEHRIHKSQLNACCHNDECSALASERTINVESVKAETTIKATLNVATLKIELARVV